MAIMTHEVGAAICAALGLEPSDTKSIDIHMEAGDLVTATIVHMVSKGEANELALVMKQYVLCEPDANAE